MKRILRTLPLAALLALTPALIQASSLPAPAITAQFPSGYYQQGYDNGVSDSQYFADAYANGTTSYESYLYNIEATRARAEELRDASEPGSDDWTYYVGYLDGLH